MSGDIMHVINYIFNKSHTYYTFFVCFVAALSGLLFGLDIGVIAGALPFLSIELKATVHMQELIVSSMMFGAVVGSINSGWISLKFGRKLSILVGAMLFIIGSFWSAISSSIEALIIARIILGLAIGISSYSVPLYLSEIAPKNIRGSMISMYQLMITIGILIAYLFDTIFSYDGSWRLMLGIITVPAFFLFIGTLFLPDSPRWLATVGRFYEAQKILGVLRTSEEHAKKELQEICENLEVKQSGWTLFKTNHNFRRVVYLGMLLQIMQQFTGINTIMYYTPKIFNISGFTSTIDQMYGTVIIGLVNVFATFMAICLVDQLGRRLTLKLGFLIMAISMIFLGLMLDINVKTNFIGYFSIFSLLTFISGFAMSAGPVIWILCSEIQPLQGRDFGITVSTTTNWISNMCIGATFLSMLETLGNTYTFLIYGILNIIFIFITIFFVPETKNISLEKIEHQLMIGKSLRDIGS